ncbi:PKD domain-containing protein [Streptomyces sp. KMM 9044]|nr:LamG-like jellyroll fold domain-containing protein [Streptomyces sp. KMM 9044]WAX81710.1 PKD domain-containing protein [Streptomyces sp. KMM 9044]
MALPTASAAPAADSEPTTLTEGQRALAKAAESGERVEVVGERSERTTVFANPDGFSFTLEESSVPVRVEDSDGGWLSPDPTLVRRADGSVGPKAAAVPMSFSGGGEDDPLARISESGQSLELSWPGELPEPVLDGASAVYPNVLPDVDLQVTATVESFQQVLVVKTPEAAALPQVKEPTFGLKTKGLTVRKGAAGNLAAVDGDGNTVFKAPTAQMWNSAGKQADPQPDGTTTQLGTAVTALDDPVVPGDPSETAPSGTGLAPGQGDEVVRMDVTVDKDSLAVVSDPQLLTSTESGAFPIFIDPTVSWGEAERTLLRNDGYESYGWGNGSDGRGMGMGKCGTWNGHKCGPGYVQRLYFEFSPASLKGKHVLDATFRITEPWAFQCEPRWVDLVRTPDNISSATTWATRPQGGWDTMVDRHVSAGRGSLCDPNSPDAPIEFNDNLPDEPNENLTATVRSFAEGKFSRLTLMLKAHDETDTAAWKRFKNDATLAVDFVGLPAKPSNIGLASGTSHTCSVKESAPTMVSDPTPVLTSTPQTAPGGESEAQLRVAMDVDKKLSDGTWTNAITEMERPTTGYVGDNHRLTGETPTLADGGLYRYRSWTRSYYNEGKNQLPGPSNASTTGWCYFTVDSSRPEAPTITVGTPYLPCVTNDCPSAGAPNAEATFTVRGEANVVAYQYRMSQEAAWSPDIAGSTATIKVTPKRAGLHTLYVRAKDNVGAGRYGSEGVIDFLVATTEPAGRWHFAETSGATAVDAATVDGSDDATLAGATRDDRGRRGLIKFAADGAPLQDEVTDRGLVLDGVDDYAATDGQVLETRSSYTVAAWVRVDPAASHTLTVMGQTPTTSPFAKKYSPFYLSYDASSGNTWSMRTLSSDATYHEIKSKQPSPRGVWTHVAGVHNAQDKTISLYVNGVPQGSTPAGDAWEADGPLQIGRVMHADAYKDFMHGSIDEVTVWQHALGPEELQDEAKLLTSQSYAGVELMADFTPTSTSSTSITDATSGYDKTLNLSGGAHIEQDTIVFDGVDDAATASGPLVDDSASFTASALVQLDKDAIASKPIGYTGQVFGQRAQDGSAWGMWYRLAGKDTVWNEETLEEETRLLGEWRFGRLNTDGTFSGVVSDEVEVGSDVRLTGIHDSVDGKVGLYISYVDKGETTSYTAKIGSGEFAVGTAYMSGAWKHHLPAQISSVRLWAGAMAGSAQVESYVGD